MNMNNGSAGHEPVVRHVNGPPTVLNGCTAEELHGCIVVSFAGLALPVLILVFTAGFGGQLFLLWFIGSMGATYFLTLRLRAYKQGKPVGYLEQRLDNFKSKMGFGKSYIFSPRGRLSLGRTKRGMRR